MNELIRLEGITKKFGEHLIIPTLDLTINDGEFVTLLGPSGCGKTTLLRMIAGLENVNMVFQNYALFPHMTVTENIHFGLKMQGVPNEEAQERINQVLYLTQLEQLRDRYPSQMSGGQQQRVAIARALVNSPKVLLLDEPLGALDYQLRKKLQLELKNLQRGLGLTFVFVTHDQEEALTMSDRIVIMHDGVIQQDGDPNGIYHHPKNTFFGTVVDIVFYGTIDKVFIRLDNTNQTVIAYQYFDDVHRWQADDRVGIWWYDRDGVKVEKE